MLTRLLQIVWCSLVAGVIRASLYDDFTGVPYRNPVWWSMLSRMSARPLGDPGRRVLRDEVVVRDGRRHLRGHLLHPVISSAEVLQQVADVGVLQACPQLAERHVPGTRTAGRPGR